MKFVVKQGEVRINSITTLQYTEEFICLHIDFKAKYPCFGGLDINDGLVEISFYADEHTLGIGKSKSHTIVKIAKLSAPWIKAITSGRVAGNIKHSANIGRYSAVVLIGKAEDDLKRFTHWSRNHKQ